MYSHHISLVTGLVFLDKMIVVHECIESIAFGEIEYNPGVL